jgi:hypothetical protein
MTTVLLLVAVLWLAAAAGVVVFMAGATRSDAAVEVVREAERIIEESR